MKKTIKCVIFLIVFYFGILFIFYDGVAEDEIDLTINSKELYDLTNTFEYNSNYEKNSARYNITRENVNFKAPNVDEGKPLLTVFTHGLEGDASHWSNVDGFFGYTNDSLISRLANTTDSNVYWIRFEKQNNFKIFNITNFFSKYTVNNNLLINVVDDDSIAEIKDISKHSIIVFEASSAASSGTNDEVYTEFNYAISRVVYDVKKINSGKLPKMNLIGHSRGGITNIQYALDHPDLVDSIYSFGTPYLGSTSASLDYYFLDSSFANRIAESDIVNSEVYEKYLERWNSNYDEFYSKIKVTALGGYSTLYGLCKGFTTDESISFISNKFGVSKEKLQVLIPFVLGSIDGIIMSFYFITPIVSIKPLIAKALMSIVSELINELNLDIGPDDLLQIFQNEIFLDYHPPFVSWYNDCLVDLGSQLGYRGEIQVGGLQYKGFNRVTKCFNGTNCNFEATSMSNMPAVVHNLEARDVELGNYVLSTISTAFKRNDEYEISIINENECSVDLYKGDTKDSILTIPEYINGKKVISISDYAFANNCYGKTNITTINIPDTVKIIGENAFYNSDCIININISENSELEEIRRGAFSNITNLKSLVIPKNVDYIDEGTFFNTPINSFQIKENNNYSWENNILINKNVTDKNNLIAIYANPDVSEIVIPDSVGIISASLFENNRNIKTINLNNVKYIGTKAFANSSLTNIISGSNITNVEDYAFANTPWFDDQDSEFITLGKTLISYTGSEKEVVIPEGITRICGNTFNSEGIEEIILPSTIEVLCVDAFTNCKNLKSILFTSSQPPILNGTIANTNVTFLVRDDCHEKYINSIYYKNINNEIDVKKINVKFYDINDNYLDETLEVYGSTFDNFIKAPKIIGNDFKHWIDQNGNEIYENSYLSAYKNLILKPYYETSKYTIIFDDGQNGTIQLEYGQKVGLDKPEKDGYDFLGWYDSDGNLIISKELEVVWDKLNGIEALYAQYKLINYKITYDTKDGVFINDNLKYTFNVENPITEKDIPEIRKFGYVFDYWLCGGAKFITTYGRYEDVDLEASYKGDTFNKYNGNTITINHEYSILDLKDYPTSNRLVFTIANNAKTVTFKSNNKDFSNMRIVITNRTDALVLGFENIKFQPAKEASGKGLCAVECLSKCDIYISFKGNVEIVGGEGADGHSYYIEHKKATNNQNGVTGWYGQNGYDGGYGIRGDKIIFSQFDNESFIKVIGGRGGRGGRGENGQDGSDGVNSPSGSIWSPKKGDDGAKGGTGGRGGNGGNGAFGIYVSSSNNLLVSDAMNYRFYGGSGGDGGLGGTGGRGGNGASDTNASMFNGVGDPGNGGSGGLGGKGGNGGNGSTGSNALNVYGYGGIGGLRGAGNQGGAGGLGGNSGKNGDNGSNGKTGIMGVSGSSGVGGIDGYNVIGNELGIKDTPYVFNKDFIIHIFN